jgi:regulator of protease activity HflC (stomatin/prohibitin superfamily)
MSAGWCFFSADLQVSADRADVNLRSDPTDGARVLAHRHHANPSQKIITKDNVSIDIAAVAYYHITDPKKAVIAIENVYNSVNQISQTTVRNVVGRFSLDHCCRTPRASMIRSRTAHRALEHPGNRG